MNIFRSFLATVLFIVVLLAVYYIHINFFRVDVIFYAAILDGVVAAIITAVLLLATRFLRVLSALELVQLVVIWLLGGYAFAISIPTVIDRSLSFYILEKLEQRGGGIREDAIRDVFINEYIPEYRLVDVRLTEQEQSGTIEIKDGCVLLTPKGYMVADMGQFFRQHFLAKKRLLGNEYTDVLTDPFRNSIETPDYTCK